MNAFLKRLEVRVSGAYAIVAILWIILSDMVLDVLFKPYPQLMTVISIFKGLIFVAVTAIGLYISLSLELRKRTRLEYALEQDIAERKQAEAELEKAHSALELKVIQRTAELKAAKDRAEAILNYSFDGIVLVNAELKIEQTNAAFNRLIVCEPDTYFSRPVLDVIHSDDKRRVAGLISTLPMEESGKPFDAQVCRQDWHNHQCGIWCRGYR